MRDAWQLAKPYWLSEDKRWAWGLLLTVIGLNLGMVYINVRLSFWQNHLFNALQALDAQKFFEQLGVFALLVASFVAVGVYQQYLKQMLHLRWRQWMTQQYLERWLTQKAYYRLQLEGPGTDNPDQRIAEDVDRFTDITLTLGLGVLSSFVTLCSFLGILWSLSGRGGYMVWAAFIYAGFGTWITHKIGKPLIGLNFEQQKREADFRFGLVRLRENTEAVALLQGETQEASILQALLGHVVHNFKAIMKQTKMLGWWTYSYNQLGFIFPFIMTAPRFFAKEIQLGGLMQTSQAFHTIQTALFFFIDSYGTLANWRSVVERLAGFHSRVLGSHTAPLEQNGEGLEVQDLSLALPNGQVLLQSLNLNIAPGASLLIMGPTGSGKSTLLRALAGIWPYASGEIRMGTGESIFLPQKPYLPLGTLSEALSYPYAANEQDLKETLRTVGLTHLESFLHQAENWGLRLSLGEQQRIAFARILLRKPAFIFLDEATSALDEPTEAYFYLMLQNASWKPTILSVGHRNTLQAFHESVFKIGHSSDIF